MLRRLLSFILVISLILGTTTIALADPQPQPIIMIDNNTLDLKNQTYINEEGKLMLPLREVFEELDYKVEWNGKNRSIRISNGSQDIKLKVGEYKTSLKESRTFMPLSFINNSSDLILGLENKGEVVKINKPIKNPEDYFKISEDRPIKTKLEEYMNALEKNQNFYGSVLVGKDNKILLNRGYGFSDVNQEIKNKSGTRFAIGSITKQMTAMGIMQLVEKDLINVEDKVSEYIPDAPHGDKVNIHNLLTHSSGLANYTNTEGFLNGDITNKSPAVMLDAIKNLPLEFNSGERFEYSNTNYLLLGMIIEKVSGKSLENYLEENIFKPLKMNSTGTSYGKSNNSPDASPYTGYLDVNFVDDRLTLTQSYGAGNIYSTVEDLYRWERSLNTEKLVKKETLGRIFTEYTTISDGSSYGYGWMFMDTDKGKRIFHGGNTFGYSSNIDRYVDEDLVIIILTNKGMYDVEKLSNTLSNIVFNEKYEKPEKIEEIKIDNPEVYDKYIGKYGFMDGTIDIIKKDDGLYAQVTGQPEFKILPQGKNKFFSREIDIEIEFIEEENGEVNEFIFKQLGLEINPKRIKEQEEVEIDPAIYDKYIGKYQLSPDIVIDISKENNNLYAQLTGQDKFQIFPKSENKFFYKVVQAEITFVEEESKVTKLILHQNGQDLPANKLNN